MSNEIKVLKNNEYVITDDAKKSIEMSLGQAIMNGVRIDMQEVTQTKCSPKVTCKISPIDVTVGVECTIVKTRTRTYVMKD